MLILAHNYFAESCIYFAEVIFILLRYLLESMFGSIQFRLSRNYVNIPIKLMQLFRHNLSTKINSKIFLANAIY